MGEAERGTEILAEIEPMLFGNGKENFNHLGIELGARTPLNLLASVRHREGVAIWPVANHSIQGVSNRKNARAKRNLVSLQTAGIAGTIEKLLMGEDDLRSIAEERDADQHLVADLTMRTHDLFFLIIQGARFAQDAIRDGHLPDVVKKRSARQDSQVWIRYGHGSGDGDAKCRNALAMAFGLRVLQVERAAQRLEHVVVGVVELRDCFGKPRGFLLHKLFEASLLVSVFRDQPPVP